MHHPPCLLTWACSLPHCPLYTCLTPFPIVATPPPLYSTSIPTLARSAPARYGKASASPSPKAPSAASLAAKKLLGAGTGLDRSDSAGGLLKGGGLGGGSTADLHVVVTSTGTQHAVSAYAK